jgi:predicted AlkP superfamily pyrophosphatase or phosphodiesterase
MHPLLKARPRFALIAFSAIAFALSAPALPAAAAPRAEHLVIIGIDGLGAYGLQGSAKLPNIERLRQAGAYTYHARGVMPTSSSPNWASMIMGAGPELHGVTSNAWQPDQFDIPPAVTGPEGIFPTIFGLLRAQRPASKIAFFTEWKDFPRLLERKAINELYVGESAEDTAEHAAATILKSKPSLVFVQFDHVDHAGHKFGHETPEYFAAVEKADALIGQIVDALKKAGIHDRTVVLVTADHGGTGKKHGDPVLRQIEIPWIIAGPGIARGKQIQSPLATYDTAATAAYILGLQPPRAWTGRPVLEAFTKGAGAAAKGER